MTDQEIEQAISLYKPEVDLELVRYVLERDGVFIDNEFNTINFASWIARILSLDSGLDRTTQEYAEFYHRTYDIGLEVAQSLDKLKTEE